MVEALLVSDTVMAALLAAGGTIAMQFLSSRVARRSTEIQSRVAETEDADKFRRAVMEDNSTLRAEIRDIRKAQETCEQHRLDCERRVGLLEIEVKQLKQKLGGQSWQRSQK